MTIRFFAYTGLCFAMIGASAGKVSVKRINSADNQLAGTRLGNFFTSQRVIDGDEFFVNVTD